MRTWRKEDYWLTWKRHDHNLEDYMSIFGGYVQNAAQRDRGKMILGSGDPNVVWYYLENDLDESNIHAPHLLKMTSPGAKVIIMLRQPTDRLFSDFNYRSVPSSDPGSVRYFHQTVTSRIEEYVTCLRQYTLRQCFINRRDFFIDEGLGMAITHSLYVLFLHEWFRAYDADDILVIKTEDYSRNCSHTLKQVFNFLGLDPLDDQTVDELSQLMRLNSAGETPLINKPHSMLNDTRRILDEFFQPFNEALATLLNDDRYLWR